MGIANFFAWFLPREKRFHTLFEEDSANLRQAAELFQSLVASQDLEARRTQARQLKDFEARGDEITGKIFDTLNTTFLTPLDREDIRDLAWGIDNVLDDMEMVGSQLVQFKLTASPKELREMSRILLSSTVEIEVLTSLVWKPEKADEAHRRLIRISELENQADAIFTDVITRLFDDTSGDADPIKIMKWKEIYHGLENSIDRCKDVSHAIGNIVSKNS